MGSKLNFKSRKTSENLQSSLHLYLKHFNNHYYTHLHKKQSTYAFTLAFGLELVNNIYNTKKEVNHLWNKKCTSDYHLITDTESCYAKVILLP